MTIKTFEEWCSLNNVNEPVFEDHKKYVKSTFKKYPFMDMIVDTYQIYQHDLYETLFYSYDKDKLKQELLSKFGDLYEMDTIDNNVGKDMLLLKYKTNHCIHSKEFNRILNFYNYTLTYIDEDDKTLYIEPNVPKEMTDYVYNECSGIVYHITKNQNTYDNIMKYGLKPKTSSYRKYNNRVFYTYGKTKKEIKQNIQDILNIFIGSNNHIDAKILKINLNLFRDNVKFFKDSTINDINAIWSSEYIPPYCIELVELNNL